jgi:type IV pilus assembly protein PilA
MINKLRQLREKRAHDEGFTLIELLVVVVIIGVLIAIAIPLYLNYQKGSHDKAAQSDVRNAVITIEQCYTDNSNAYPTAGAMAGNTMTFTGCNGGVANTSSGTTLVYTAVGTGYTISGSAADGHAGKTYSYASAVGGQVS